jgi:hypothetical protein
MKPPLAFLRQERIWWMAAFGIVAGKRNKNLARIAAPGWMYLPVSYRRIPILWRSSALNCAQIKPTQATVTITRALRTANTIMGTSFQIYPY